MEQNTRNTNNSSSNKYGIIISSATESLEDGSGKVSDTEPSMRTPIAETDPFKRAPRLVRSPTKVLNVEKPAPALQDSTPQAKAVQSPRDYMSELGDAIKKLMEVMHPPQRSINKTMRDTLSQIARLHASAHGEYNRIKEDRRNVLIMPATVETTPKRPRDENHSMRRTPLKKKKNHT